jgi:ubiquinone/menaquinone biosynthesis C-methylase UbiE
MNDDRRPLTSTPVPEPGLGISGRLLLALAVAGRRVSPYQQAEDLEAADHDVNYFENEVRRGLRFGDLFNHPFDVEGKDVLEIGCGFGGMLAALVQQGASRVVGIEIDPQRLEFARSRLADQAELHLADAADLPFPDRTFDIVICDSTFEHVADLHATLAQAYRVLRPGGLVYGLWGNPWWSANGPHHMKIIPVPWAQIPFSHATLVRVVRHLGAKGEMPASYLEYKLVDLHRMGRNSRRKFANAARASAFEILEHRNTSPRRWKNLLIKVPGIDELLAGQLIEVLRKPYRSS